MPNDVADDEELIDACIHGDAERVAAALAKGARPNAPGKIGRTAFHVAAKNGHVEIAKELLAMGCDIDAPDPNGSTPLAELVGSHGDDLDFVSFLLDNGAAIDAENHDGWTALLFACKWDARWNALVQLLIDRGADVNHKSLDGWTPLLLAINSRVVSNGPHGALLACKRTDVEQGGRFGWTPLCHAVAHNSSDEIVKALIARGADVNHAMRVGAAGKAHRCRTNEARARQRDVKAKPEHDLFTPLMWAAQKNRFAVVKMLLAAGAQVSAKSASGLTALTACKGKPMKKLLLEAT